MKRQLYLGLVLVIAIMLFGCGAKDSEKVSDTDANSEEEMVYDDNYDSSVEKFIWYARALGEGYEKDFGSNKVEVGKNTTIFIGDSFFDRRNFWTTFYSDHYKGKDAFLAGIGSTTTADWQHLLDTVFAGFKEESPKNIVVHLGTNDLWDETTTAYDVKYGLTMLFGTLHEKYPQTKIYYFGITHRADGSAQDRIDETNQLMAGWCTDNSSYMTYIDTPSRITAEDLQGDGLHPTLEAYSIFTQALQEAGCAIEEKK